MTSLFLYATLLAFVPYFVAVSRAPRLEWQRVRWIVVAIALAARVAMLASPIVLSDDAYRYLWEGKIQRAGFNPYKYAPDAPKLAPLQRRRSQHKKCIRPEM